MYLKCGLLASFHGESLYKLIPYVDHFLQAFSITPTERATHQWH